MYVDIYLGNWHYHKLGILT